MIIYVYYITILNVMVSRRGKVKSSIMFSEKKNNDMDYLEASS